MRFSDDTARMPCRNDSNYMRSGGNKSEMGRFSFAYFSLARQRKVRPTAGVRYLICDSVDFNIVFRLYGESLFFMKAIRGFYERKVTKRKDTLQLLVSCALQKITVVPTRHPCRVVTQTNVLFV